MLIRGADPDKLTPQQRANWRLIQAVLDSEYERGFQRGLACGKAEAAADGTLFMHTRPYDPGEFTEKG